PAAAARDGRRATETAPVAEELRLPNRQGLHARPAATVAAAAKGFRADVRLLRGADAANAKSVTAILLLATRPNDAIRVSASGPDAAAAVSALAALLAAGSGESGATAEAPSGPVRGAPVTAAPVAGSVPAAAPAPAEGPTRSTDPRKLLGVSASPGLVLGKVAQLRRASIHVEERGAGIERERAHLDVALERARQQIEAQRAANIGAASKILDAHLELLADPELIDLAVAGLADGRARPRSSRARSASPPWAAWTARRSGSRTALRWSSTERRASCCAIRTRPRSRVRGPRSGGSPRNVRASGLRRAHLRRRPTDIASRWPPTSAPSRKLSPQSPRVARVWDCSARSCCSSIGTRPRAKRNRPTSTGRSLRRSVAIAGSSSARSMSAATSACPTCRCR